VNGGTGILARVGVAHRTALPQGQARPPTGGAGSDAAALFSPALVLAPGRSGGGCDVRYAAIPAKKSPDAGGQLGSINLSALP